MSAYKFCGGKCPQCPLVLPPMLTTALLSSFITVARARGDPHFTTIDGRRYTFNGLGEYVLLRTNISDIEFQGRTTLAPNSGATIFSAFALREGDDIVEVSNLVHSESF